MAGHSHWAGIKHKKGANDARRGKLFSKLARHIIAAARNGGDPVSNLALRYAIDKARQANMSKDNIERAIKKGTGELEGIRFVELTYEGYGPGGIAILADALTDNRTRTAGEVRRIFEKHHGRLGESGSVAWMFDAKGMIIVEKTSGLNEDTVMETVLESGAEDICEMEGSFEILSSPHDFDAVRRAVDTAGLRIRAAEIVKIAKNMVKIHDDACRRVLALLEALEEHDDIQNISANLEIEESMAHG